MLRAGMDMPPGTVITSDPGLAVPAIANGTSLGNALGIVSSPGGVSANEIVEFSLLAGFISLITSAWDAVTGQTGGLTPDTTYYLSQTVAGALTSTKPSSGQVVQIGNAISPTAMILSGAQPSTPSGSPGATGPTGPAGPVGPLLTITDNTIEVNLGGGSFDDVDFWGGGPHTTFVEVDLVGESNTTITGIVAGADGDMLILWNGGGGTVPEDTITLINATASPSQPANRIWLANGKNYNIPNNDGLWLRYIEGFGWVSIGSASTMIRAQEFSLDPSVTPPALGNGSTTNDYDPWTAAGVRVNSNVKQDTGLASTITGIVAAGAPNSEGRLLLFQNISTTGTITFKNNNAGSIADNRILCPHGVDLAIGPQCAVTFVYDDNVAMWRVQSFTS